MEAVPASAHGGTREKTRSFAQFNVDENDLVKIRKCRLMPLMVNTIQPHLKIIVMSKPTRR